ncbi:MAG: cytochrome P450 [Spongiibacteraceae bacterium]
MTAKPISFIDNDILKCPFAAYKTLRDEQPVYLDPTTGMYVITRYEDLKVIARDTTLFSNMTNQFSNRESPVKAEIDALYRAHDLEPVPAMVDNDPPQHTAIRKLVDYAFRVSRINALQGYIENLCNELVDKFIEGGEVEVVGALAIPLPVIVIADQLGIERERIKDFKRWSDALIFSADVHISPQRMLEVNRDVLEMRLYLAQKVEEMRHHPRDNITSDLAQAQLDGKPLEMKLMVSILSGLLVAGNETTTATIALGIQYLIESGLEDTLRAQPEKIPNFVEECLRLATPLQAQFRRTTAATEIHGVKIPKDAILMVRYGAGNRDERRFDNPDEVRLDRAGGNQHLTFGFGSHFCVGNALARAELRTVFTIVLQRMKNLRLAGEPELVIHSFARGLSKLPVAFDRIG